MPELSPGDARPQVDLAHTLLRAQLAVSVHEADGTPVDATGAGALRAGRKGPAVGHAESLIAVVPGEA